MKRHLFCIVTICFSLFWVPSRLCAAQIFTAYGSGATETDAREDALNTLSSMLYVRVESNIQTLQSEAKVNGKTRKTVDDFRKSITLTSEIPLLGASFGNIEKSQDGNYSVKVVLDAETASPMYIAALKQTAKKITETVSISTRSNFSNKNDYSEITSLYEEFDKLAFVSQILGVQDIPVLPLDKAAFENESKINSQTYSSLTAAAQSIISAMPNKDKVYIYPVKYEGLPGITSFSYAFQQHLIALLGSSVTQSEKNASYFITGSYYENTDKSRALNNLAVSCRMVDKRGKVLSSSPILTLLPGAFEGKSYLPDDIVFQRKLADYTIPSVDNAKGDGLFTEIRINGRKDGLSFVEGDQMIIEVKASKPCYFYVMGYVFDENKKKFAYLFPSYSEKTGKAMFARAITAEEANTWICINPKIDNEYVSLEIIPPFGTETLQIVASTEKDYTKFLSLIPDYRETEDYYIVGKDPDSALSSTRAVNIKKKSDEVQSSIQTCEGSITFYTHAP